MLLRSGRQQAAALALAAATLALAGTTACNRGAAQGPQGMPTMPVKVQEVGSQELGNVSEYVATIKSRNSATIMSDVEGWIFDIRVKSGDMVKKGQTLMEIDPRRQAASVSNMESQRASKQANLQLAKVQLDRAKGLSASGVISKQDLDTAQSTYDAAAADVKSMDAQINQQQVQLKYYSVFAPVNGVIGDVPVHVGDRVTNTTPLTTVDERSGLEVYLPIPAERAKDLKLGAPVQLVDAAGNVILNTKVNFISPQVDTASQTILAKAPVDQAADHLRSQQLVRARITWGTEQGMTIPVVAVTRLGGQFFAFIAEQKDGKAVARQVPLALGEIVGNDYRVISGLKAGDEVIVAGGQNLADGVPIKIQQ
ncbi:MAG TPA: efflux RND transporter periplasmic adaptor subunit [Candidatus Angelobacter sp.]|nr:efflux RND transporter periplasmic adaptor subunit [Candidatus Angelobacter sp.]